MKVKMNHQNKFLLIEVVDNFHLNQILYQNLLNKIKPMNDIY